MLECKYRRLTFHLLKSHLLSILFLCVLCELCVKFLCLAEHLDSIIPHVARGDLLR
jgi:hypothetical protein